MNCKDVDIIPETWVTIQQISIVTLFTLTLHYAMQHWNISVNSQLRGRSQGAIVWRKSLMRLGKWLGLATLLLTALLLPHWQQSVQAQAIANSVATSSNWQSASFPVENFQEYTSPFGYRQSPDGSYRREFHHGLDMAAPKGSYIRNWWTGVVVEVSDSGNCGTSVIIASETWEHIYCHMQGRVEKVGGKRYMVDRAGGIQIEEGQIVPSGQRIGRVGMTGRTTGPHLHWGLRYGGQWVDPALVLRAMYAQQVSAQDVSSPTISSLTAQ